MQIELPFERSQLLVLRECLLAGVLVPDLDHDLTDKAFVRSLNRAEYEISRPLNKGDAAMPMITAIMEKVSHPRPQSSPSHRFRSPRRHLSSQARFRGRSSAPPPVLSARSRASGEACNSLQSAAFVLKFDL